MSDLNYLLGGDAAAQENRNAEGELEKNVDVIKCPNCGANMHFNADTQKMKCDYCETEIDFKKNQQITERDFNLRESDTDDWRSETVVIRCENCGNKEVVAKTEIAKICPFCGTSQIIQTEELPGIKPGAVFPFTVSKEGCHLAFNKWFRHKWFVPNKCRKMIDMNRINGVYNPAWTFDSCTASRYSGVFGKRYTTTVGSGKNRRTVTRIRYFNVSGVYEEFFDDLTIEASPSINSDTFNKLRPFDKTKAAVYDKNYLSGFMANHYDKDINTAFGEAKYIMDQRIKDAIKRRHNADVVQSLNVTTYHNNLKFKYILLPIWIGNYEYAKKKYNFYVNGNTAKVVGKVPRSVGKITAFVLGTLAVLGLGGGLAYYFTDGFEGYFERRQSYSGQIEQEFTEEIQSYEIQGYKIKY